jgi:uncharacterized protein YkwD
LAIALVAVASASASPGQHAQDPTAVCTADPSWGTLVDGLVPSLLALVNAQRAEEGEARLTLSPSLTAAAVWKARHMAAYGYLGDDDPAPPVARSFAERLSACGYSGLIAGENLAHNYGDSESVVAGWLGSPDLRATIENDRFTVTGIAVARSSSGDLYWVEDFGGPASQAPRCRVPSVVGKTLTAARRALKRNRCSVGAVLAVPSSRAPRARVIAQTPRAGTTLPSGSPVTLVVSSGRRK